MMVILRENLKCVSIVFTFSLLGFNIISCEEIVNKEIVDCGKLTSDDYYQESDLVGAVESIIYNGSYKECQLNVFNPLRIDLGRMIEISYIQISPFAIAYSSASDLSVRIVRDNGSDQKSEFLCKFYEKCDDTVSPCWFKEGYLPFRCQYSEDGYPGILANAVDIVGLSTTVVKLIDLLHEPLLVMSLKFFPGPSCLTPGYFNDHDLKVVSTKEIYRRNENIVYQCCSNENCPTKTRTCTRNGWSGSPLRCPGNYMQITEMRWKIQSQNLISFPFELPSGILLETNVIFSELNCSDAKSSSDRIISIEGLSLDGISWKIKQDDEGHLRLSKGDGKVSTRCNVTFFPNGPNLIDDNYLECTEECTINVNVTQLGLNSSHVKEVKISWVDVKKYDWELFGCPPIDPYVGMPEEYKGQESKIPDELNKKLRAKPCRDGYRHDGSNVTLQCHKPHWIGSPPKCQLITCKRPPAINHGQWRFTNQHMYHQVTYDCEKGFTANIEGLANCNYELNLWENVPVCLPINNVSRTEIIEWTRSPGTKTEATNELSKRSTTETSLVFLSIIVVLLSLLVILLTGCLIFRCRKRNGGSRAASLTADSESYVLPETRQPHYELARRDSFKTPGNNYGNIYWDTDDEPEFEA